MKTTKTDRDNTGGRRIVIFFAFLFVFLLVFHVTSYSKKISFDGEDWRNFLPIMKISYLSGIYDGSAFCEVMLSREATFDRSPMRKTFPLDLTLKEVVGRLDLFYDDDTHLYIPVVYALHIVRMELDGQPEEVIQKYKQNLLGTLGDIN